MKKQKIKSLEGLFAELEAQIKLYGGSTNFIDHESELHNTTLKKPSKAKADLTDPNYLKFRYPPNAMKYPGKPFGD